MNFIQMFEYLLGFSILEMPFFLQPVIYLAVFVFAFIFLLLCLQVMLFPFKHFLR